MPQRLYNAVGVFVVKDCFQAQKKPSMYVNEITNLLGCGCTSM